MNFKESKEYVQEIFDNINNGVVYQENSTTHKTIEDICSQARIDFKDCTCKFSDRLRDTLTELMLFFRDSTEFSKCDYIMKRGVSYIVDGVAYTKKNITNEIAERLLSERDGASEYISFVGTFEKPTNKKSTKKRL